MFPPFNPHYDVILVVLVASVGYWYLDRHTRPIMAPSAPPATTRQTVAWYSGVATIMLAAWWPMHDLAEQTLFSAHMTEHLLIGYVVPPLLLIGTPRWLAEAAIGRHFKLVQNLTSPVVGFFAFNIAIVGIHWPIAIAIQNRYAGLHIGAHLIMFATGVAMWMGIFSPTPLVPRMRPATQMMYLFLNTIVPTVPASFLTFSHEPIFLTYGDAAMSWGLTALEDQIIGGVIMKLGGGFYLLAVIVWLWVKWTREEREWDRIERQLAETPGV